MQKMQAGAGMIRLQANGDTRASGRNRLAAYETVSERDPHRRIHLQHLAQRFHAVGMADIHLASRPGIDGGAGAPPTGPSRAIGEESKNGFRLGSDHNGSVQAVWQFRHKSSLTSFLAATRFGPAARFFQFSG